MAQDIFPLLLEAFKEEEGWGTRTPPPNVLVVQHSGIWLPKWFQKAPYKMIWKNLRWKIHFQRHLTRRNDKKSAAILYTSINWGSVTGWHCSEAGSAVGLIEVDAVVHHQPQAEQLPPGEVLRVWHCGVELPPHCGNQQELQPPPPKYNAHVKRTSHTK